MRIRKAIRITFPSWGTNAVVITLGMKSLHECYPKGGYEWMKQRGKWAWDYVPTAIEELTPFRNVQVINCLPLETLSSRCPWGHLGTHADNLGLVLGYGMNNRQFRLKQYVVLWLRLQTDQMLGCFSTAMVCRQGKHRSLAWCAIQSFILTQLFGVNVKYCNLCSWAQELYVRTLGMYVCTYVRIRSFWKC